MHIVVSSLGTCTRQKPTAKISRGLSFVYRRVVVPFSANCFFRQQYVPFTNNVFIYRCRTGSTNAKAAPKRMHALPRSRAPLTVPFSGRIAGWSTRPCMKLALN